MIDLDIRNTQRFGDFKPGEGNIVEEVKGS